MLHAKSSGVIFGEKENNAFIVVAMLEKTRSGPKRPATEIWGGGFFGSMASLDPFGSLFISLKTVRSL